MPTTIANTILMSAIFATLIAIFQEGGKYWSRFMENKMAVSHFTDNKFGISRFTRKKTFLYDQFFSFWLRTTAKELPCSMTLPFSRFLFLVLWKGKQSRDLPIFLFPSCWLSQTRSQLEGCRGHVSKALGREWRFSNAMCTRQFNRTVEVIISLEKLKITWKKITLPVN